MGQVPGLLPLPVACLFSLDDVVDASVKNFCAWNRAGSRGMAEATSGGEDLRTGHAALQLQNQAAYLVYFSADDPGVLADEVQNATSGNQHPSGLPADSLEAAW
jgi:hypothetical protein